MFGHVFSWLGAHLALWPSVALIVVGLAWTALWIPANDGDGDAQGGVTLGAVAIVGWFVASIFSAQWVYWLPFLTGCSILPMIFGSLTAADALQEWQKKRAAEAKKLREQMAREAKRRAEERLKSPAGVIARCEAVVKKYIDALPQDLLIIEERRQAETKLDALRGLYKLLDAIEKLGPDDEESFEKHLAAADALFSDVSLEKECGALVRELRERSVTKAPPVLKIHSAIEALVLSIESLPGKAAARIAEQVPTEYRVSAEDMAAEMGHPVLPVIDLTPEPEAQPKAPPRARRQLA
jgi:hypothetical protein